MSRHSRQGIRQLADALGSGRATVGELVESSILRAEADQSFGAYLARFDGAAREQAARLDDELRSGRVRGPLHGIPLAVKDLLATDEGPTTAQSRALDPRWREQGDGQAVRRLRRAGMVVMGKTTTMELATGWPEPEDGFPVPRNPWDPDRWPGGSSSGSAVAVAARVVPAALATDTGGSIRCPAALTGVTGFKPTYGVVPVSGCVPVGSTFDHVGPIAGSAEDCALLTAALSRPDDDESSPQQHPTAADSLLHRDLSGVRIGVPRHVFEAATGVSASVRDSTADAVQTLADAGAEVSIVTLRFWDELGDATMLEALCEHYASAADMLRERWAMVGRSARASIAVGALVTAPDRAAARRVLAHVGREYAALWDSLDLIVTPTTPRPAFLLSERSELARFPRLTAPWNGLGVPALTVPMRPSPDGLPLGLQIAGPAGRDAQVLAAGHAFQQLTRWHLAEPTRARAREEHGGDQHPACGVAT